MEQLLNNHIDEMEALESEVHEMIDRVISEIKIASLVANPEKEIARIATMIRAVLKEVHIPKAVKMGIDIANLIRKKIEKIDIQDTDDPKLNKELADESKN